MSTMIPILSDLLNYLKTNDEKYLDIKYHKSQRYALMNMLESINIPEDENDYSRGYREGAIKVLEKWLQNEENKAFSQNINYKKKID